MSWSTTFDSIAALEKDEPTWGTLPDPRDQYETARQAALDLVASGAVGDADVFDFNITLSGHANPEHVPTSGWSNDGIMVSVTQKGPRTPATPRDV